MRSTEEAAHACAHAVGDCSFSNDVIIDRIGDLGRGPRDFVAFRHEERARHIMWCGARHLPISACAESICALFGASLFALAARRGGRGVFRAGVRFHIARDHHRVY